MSDSIAITSGKGGVGKTTVSVNLSIAFQKLQNKVLLLDTDLGMANSHVLLGVNPTNNLSSVINGNKKISEVVVKTDYEIELVSGGSATSDLLNLENKKRFRVLNEIDDYLKNYEKVKLIVDVAAGAEDNAVIFANACGRIVVIIVGEPTSFVDSYSLIKTIYQKSSFKNFCILVNQVENSKIGKDLFKRFEIITSKFLDVKLHYVGSLNDSKKVKNSIINRKPIIITAPDSDISFSFKKIANEILKTPQNEWGGLSFSLGKKKRA